MRWDSHSRLGMAVTAKEVCGTLGELDESKDSSLARTFSDFQSIWKRADMEECQ